LRPISNLILQLFKRYLDEYVFALLVLFGWKEFTGIYTTPVTPVVLAVADVNSALI